MLYLHWFRGQVGGVLRLWVFWGKRLAQGNAGLYYEVTLPIAWGQRQVWTELSCLCFAADVAFKISGHDWNSLGMPAVKYFQHIPQTMNTSFGDFVPNVGLSLCPRACMHKTHASMYDQRMDGCYSSLALTGLAFLHRILFQHVVQRTFKKASQTASCQAAHEAT